MDQHSDDEVDFEDRCKELQTENDTWMKKCLDLELDNKRLTELLELQQKTLSSNNDLLVAALKRVKHLLHQREAAKNAFEVERANLHNDINECIRMRDVQADNMKVLEEQLTKRQ
jgi:hypothetical protein